MREALSWAAAGRGTVHEVFLTDAAESRHGELVRAAELAGLPVSVATDRALAGLSETVTPQGIVAVCQLLDVSPSAALASTHGQPRLVAVLVEVADPGNAGTVIRVADAAGADAVLFAGDAVDPHNGKCVRASAGSLFHLPIGRSRAVPEVLAACRSAGLHPLAADGHADDDLDSVADRGDLLRPTAWVFGGEAHGLPAEVRAELPDRVRVPVYGAAESLNLATAAAVCLYASARAHNRGGRAVRYDTGFDETGPSPVRRHGAESNRGRMETG